MGSINASMSVKSTILLTCMRKCIYDSRQPRSAAFLELRYSELMFTFIGRHGHLSATPHFFNTASSVDKLTRQMISSNALRCRPLKNYYCCLPKSPTQISRALYYPSLVSFWRLEIEPSISPATQVRASRLYGRRSSTRQQLRHTRLTRPSIADTISIELCSLT